MGLFARRREARDYRTAARLYLLPGKCNSAFPSPNLRSKLLYNNCKGAHIAQSTALVDLPLMNARTTQKEMENVEEEIADCNPRSRVPYGEPQALTFLASVRA